MASVIFYFFIFVVFIVSNAFFAIICIYIAKGLLQKPAQWDQVAARLGLTYSDRRRGKLKLMTGTYQSVPLKVATIRKYEPLSGASGPRKTRTYLTIQAWFPSHHTPAMSVQRQTTLKKLLGRDIKLDDKALDKLLLIESPDPKAVRRLLLHPEVRATLLDCFRRPKSLGTYKIEGNFVYFTAMPPSDDEALTDKINHIVAFAQTIARASDELFRPAEQSPAPTEPVIEPFTETGGAW